MKSLIKNNSVFYLVINISGVNPSHIKFSRSTLKSVVVKDERRRMGITSKFGTSTVHRLYLYFLRVSRFSYRIKDRDKMLEEV